MLQTIAISMRAIVSEGEIKFLYVNLNRKMRKLKLSCFSHFSRLKTSRKRMKIESRKNLQLRHTTIAAGFEGIMFFSHPTTQWSRKETNRWIIYISIPDEYLIMISSKLQRMNEMKRVRKTKESERGMKSEKSNKLFFFTIHLLSTSSFTFVFPFHLFLL